MKPLALLAVSTFALAAVASPVPESARYDGHLHVGPGENPLRGPGEIVAYDNITIATGVNAGVSSTDLGAVWGDEMTTLGTGVLRSLILTVFNGNGSAGSLTGGTVAVTLRRAADGSEIGAFSRGFTFPTPLAAGAFRSVTLSGLADLGIHVDTTDLIVQQSFVSTAGTADRLGVVSLHPLLPGTSSGPTLYVDADTLNGGVPGFVQLTDASGAPVDFDTGYRIVVPAPGAALLGAAALLLLRRGR